MKTEKMTAAKLLEKYDDAMKTLAIDIIDVPQETRPAMMMRQRECRDEVVTLMDSYTELLRGNAFIIFPQGEPADIDTFIRLAGEEADTISISAETLYARLATFVEDSMGTRRQFGITQLGLLIDGVTQIARELKLSNLKSPTITDVEVCSSRDSLIQTVRRIVRAAAGDDINKAFVARQLTEKAREIRYTQNITPVIISDVKDDELESLGDLFSGVSFKVPVSPGMNSEKVLEAMTDIRKRLKALKSTPTNKQ
jgi:hypothetical protein